MLRRLPPQLPGESDRASFSRRDLPPSGLETSIHACENIFTRNHLHLTGVDLIEAALDLRVPGGFHFSGRDALIVDQEEFRQPLSFVRREPPGFIEESLRV